MMLPTENQNYYCLLPTAFLAPLSWYRLFLHHLTALSDTAAAEAPVVEVCESFEKQTMRNRCRIAGPNGVQTLTVPVEHSESKQLTRDVKISYRTRWQHQHLMALRSAYRHTPFYDYLADAIVEVYDREFTFLVDLNEAMHEAVVGMLLHERHLPPLRRTTWWQGRDVNSAFVDSENIQPYYQIFATRQGFQPNLSIVDLLFNIGPEAILYLRPPKR